MANVAEKYGLRPVRKLDGSPFINAQNDTELLVAMLQQFSKVTWLNL